MGPGAHCLRDLGVLGSHRSTAPSPAGSLTFLSLSGPGPQGVAFGQACREAWSAMSSSTKEVPVAQPVSSASRERHAPLSSGHPHSGLRDLLTHAYARLRHSSLDAALASGADPCDSQALAWRAAWLTRSRTRDRLAASIDHVLAAADRRVPRLSSAVEPDRREVIAARPHLAELRELLRSTTPVYAQGVAMLRQLLRDGGSSVYVPAWRGMLAQELEDIVAALKGRDRRSLPWLNA
jgi:hypothetical protein